MTLRLPEPTLADLLEEDILFGRLRPRERLVEDELMERKHATRHAVRQALVELELRHLVARIPNKGAQVRDFSREDIQQICQMRDWLHDKAARCIPMPADPAWIERLKTLQRAHDAAVDAAEPIAVHRSNSAFHAELFSACQNRYLAQSIHEHAQLSLAYRCHLMTRKDLAAKARDEHWQMIDAIAQGDSQRLAELCVAHTKAAQQVYAHIQGWDEAPGAA